VSIKAVRQTILQTLQDNLTGIKTWWTGYPFYIETRHTPFVAVFSESETDDWRGQRSYQANYQLTIMVGIDARGEAESRNRGIQDEDWLNDIAEQIVSLLYTKLHHIGSANLQGEINIDYRNGGGNIRTVNITVNYTEMIIFTPE